MPVTSGREVDGYGDRELVDALGLHAAPREVSYFAVVVGVVLVGALATFLVSRVAAIPRSAPESAEPSVATGELHEAEALFRRGKFAEAQQAFAMLARAHPENARVRDYLTRLVRVDADAALLASARTKLQLGDPQQALALTRDVAPNSALYADAWAIARAAQEEITRAQHEAERRARDAEALEAARLADEESRLREAEARPARGRKSSKRARAAVR